MKKIWTNSEVDILVKLFADNQTIEVANKLNRTYSQVANKAHLLGLSKSESFMKSLNSGRANIMKNGAQYRFPKGHEPFNKGRKWAEYVKDESAKAMLKTAFKKGNLPHNTRSDFEISPRGDKSGRVYKYIRIGLGKWVPLHIYNWEQVNGKVPTGHILIFKGSTDDCSPENVELITRAENMRRNTIQRFPAEIKTAIKTLSKLNKTIKHHAKEQNRRPA